MKLKRHYLLLGMLIAALVQAQTVEIPDLGLESAIRVALNKLTGDITVADMESLTELDASRSSPSRGSSFLIHSLEGLETARNLISLQLRGSPFVSLRSPSIDVEDFSPLKDLTSLEEIDLSWNDLTDQTDYSFLEGLTGLTTLGLGWNNLSDQTELSFLKDITSLTTLNLSVNQSTDFSFLKRLTNLRTLDLSENRLTDFSFLEGLTNLRTLDLSRAGLADRIDLIFLEGLTSLTTLNLRGNRLTDLSLPEGSSSLTWLNLGNNQRTLKALEVPVGFNLERLQLEGFDKANLTFYIPIHVAWIDGKVEVSWTQGRLQALDEFGGTWRDAGGATSPYRVESIGPTGFFRAILE